MLDLILTIVYVLIIFITIVADRSKNEVSFKQVSRHLHFLYTKNIDYNPCRSKSFNKQINTYAYNLVIVITKLLFTDFQSCQQIK